jgi:hypothetical protein
MSIPDIFINSLIYLYNYLEDWPPHLSRFGKIGWRFPFRSLAASIPIAHIKAFEAINSSKRFRGNAD